MLTLRTNFDFLDFIFFSVLFFVIVFPIACTVLLFYTNFSVCSVFNIVPGPLYEPSQPTLAMAYFVTFLFNMLSVPVS